MPLAGDTAGRRATESPEGIRLGRHAERLSGSRAYGVPGLSGRGWGCVALRWPLSRRHTELAEIPLRLADAVSESITACFSGTSVKPKSPARPKSAQGSFLLSIALRWPQTDENPPLGHS